MRAYQLPKGGAGIESVTRVDLPEPKPQHRQVLGDGGLLGIKSFKDLASRNLAIAQQFDNGNARRMGQGLEYLCFELS